MDLGKLLSDDDDSEEAPSAAAHAARVPYPINVGGAQLLPGRTRRCCFWISVLVSHGMRYIIDTQELLRSSDRWLHNPAGDAIPDDCLLVVINPRDADQIRKAMATWKAVPHPAFVAARIIDSMCREDPTLSGRMRWKVRS